MWLPTNKIHKISALVGVKDLKPKSINLIVTSPPYWLLRMYNTKPDVWGGSTSCIHEWDGSFCKHCNAWQGELGLEPTIDLYIDHLVSIFVDVKPALVESANLFINLDDTYAKKKLINIKPKSLCMIPERFAIKMVENGFILNRDIQWYKKNVRPSSTTDRFSNDMESIMFFSVSTDNYFNKALLEINTTSPRLIENQLGSVWDIPTQAFLKAHFAVFPDALPERCIIYGCPPGGTVLDMFSGSGKTVKMAKLMGLGHIGFELNEEFIKISEEEMDFLPPLW